MPDLLLLRSGYIIFYSSLSSMSNTSGASSAMSPSILIVSRQQDLIVILQSNLVLWLYICVELYRTVTLHTGTSRNQLTNDYVLLQTDQMVNLTIDSRLGQNLWWSPGRMLQTGRNR